VAKVTTMQVMFLDATKFRRTLGWCVDENVVLTGAFYGTKCADGVEAAEEDYNYYHYTYGVPDDFTNEAEAVALAAACGLAVVADLDDCQCGHTSLTVKVDAWLGGDATTYGHIATWDVSCVADMGWMFYDATAFNGDLRDWDVAKVTNMQMMFHEAAAFDQDLGWCVDENVLLIGAFAGTKCADGVEAAEEDYYYNYYFYGVPDDFTNEAEAVALAAACGVDVRADC
jgi:surface protein